MMIHLLLICMTRFVSRLAALLVGRFAMNLLACLTCMVRFVVEITPYLRLVLGLALVIKILLAFASETTEAEFSFDALALFLSMALWLLSSLRTSANTSPNEEKGPQPMILPLYQILRLSQQESCRFDHFLLSSYGDCNCLKISVHSHWKYPDPAITFSKYWIIWWRCLPRAEFLQVVVAVVVCTLGIDCRSQNTYGEYFPRVPWQLDSTYS